MSMLNSNIDNEIEILLSGDLDNLLRDQDIFSESSFQKILDPWTKKDFKPVLCARSKANSIIFGIAFVNPFLYDTWLVVPLNITDAVEIWFDVVLRIATQASDKQVKYLLGCWAKHYPVSSIDLCVAKRTHSKSRWVWRTKAMSKSASCPAAWIESVTA